MNKEQKYLNVDKIDQLTKMDDIIIEDPMLWLFLNYTLEECMESFQKYHQENKIKDYSYQTKLL